MVTMAHELAALYCISSLSTSTGGGWWSQNFQVEGGIISCGGRVAAYLMLLLGLPRLLDWKTSNAADPDAPYSDHIHNFYSKITGGAS